MIILYYANILGTWTLTVSVSLATVRLRYRFFNFALALGLEQLCRPGLSCLGCCVCVCVCGPFIFFH